MKQLYLIIFALLVTASGYAQCTTPALTSAGPSQSVCSGEAANLTATTDGQALLWFDAAIGGNHVGNGTSFQTAPLTSTTSFWAEAQNIAPGAPMSGGGKLAPTSAGSTTVVTVTSPWGLAFTTTEAFVLNSIDVFLSSATPGNIILQLKDQNYNTIETITVAAPAGGTSAAPVQFAVPLGLVLQGGMSYKLVVVSGPAMIRDLSSGGFPYEIGTVGTITGGTINDANTNSGVYYFLYNWNYSPTVICSSERQEVVVTIINTPAPGGEASQTFINGETIANLEVTGENLIWYADAAGTISLSTNTVLTNGSTYYVQQTANGCPGPLLAITVTQSLGTESQSLQDLRYYPNPVTDKLILNNLAPIDTVKIYDVQGQVVRNLQIQNVAAEIDFSTIEAGVYFVKVSASESSSVLRIVKQ